MPYFGYARCNVDFCEHDGVYMSLELVSLANNEWKGRTFVIAGISGSTVDDYLRMCRIAAECTLMFNGRGQEMTLSEPEFAIAAAE